MADLAEEVGPRAFRIALHMVGDRADAEDALQDAFVQAHRGWSGFRGESSRQTWFLRIVVNSCRRHRRLWRRWVATRTEAAGARASDGAHVDVHGDPALRARVTRAVRRLPFRQRTAFVLRYVEHLPIGEIAATMRCAPGTVKATIHKAVTRLRRELGDSR